MGYFTFLTVNLVQDSSHKLQFYWKEDNIAFRMYPPRKGSFFVVVMVVVEGNW